MGVGDQDLIRDQRHFNTSHYPLSRSCLFFRITRALLYGSMNEDSKASDISYESKGRYVKETRVLSKEIPHPDDHAGEQKGVPTGVGGYSRAASGEQRGVGSVRAVGVRMDRAQRTEWRLRERRRHAESAEEGPRMAKVRGGKGLIEDA